MNCQSSEPCEVLPWDTEFFKCRIGKVQGDTLEEPRASDIDAWSRSLGIECLYFLGRSDDPLTIRTAEAHGFALVDIRLTLEHTLEQPKRTGARTSPANSIIRPFGQGDLPRLQAMAPAVHNNTRFFNDPHFARERVEGFYSFWIAQECNGGAQEVLVAVGTNDQPIGYITCHVDGNATAGQIGLVGVAPEARGKGIGESLVFAAIDWFFAQRVSRVTVVTQGNNRPAQRLYQRCGFLTKQVQLWYHKWYPLQSRKNV